MRDGLQDIGVEALFPDSSGNFTSDPVRPSVRATLARMRRSMLAATVWRSRLHRPCFGPT